MNFLKISNLQLILQFTLNNNFSICNYLTLDGHGPFSYLFLLNVIKNFQTRRGKDNGNRRGN